VRSLKCRLQANFINGSTLKHKTLHTSESNVSTDRRRVTNLKELVVDIESYGKLGRFASDELARIRVMAIRRGVWFKVLSRLERGLVDLSLKVTEEIRSKILARAICSIVKKLLEALESKVGLLMRQMGVPLARKISQIAQNWGNKTAHAWANDLGFIRYLTIINVNTYPFNV